MYGKKVRKLVFNASLKLIKRFKKDFLPMLIIIKYKYQKKYQREFKDCEERT